MATFAITGSAGGIGSATRAQLESGGHRVIGIDIRDAEVIADLATPAGRTEMVSDVAALCGGVLDGVVAGAGVSGLPGEVTVAINYFGAIATLDGLRPMLARGTNPCAIGISSNSTTTMSGYPINVTDACLANDEPLACELASSDRSGVSIYPATKLALARWIRNQSTTAEWIGSGIRLNAIAPGYTATPMTAGTEEFMMNLGDIYPLPMRRAGKADEIAALLQFVLIEGTYFVGSFITIDGGTDAVLRPNDWPHPTQ